MEEEFKAQDRVTPQVQDVEEGEISDVEEITEAAFKKQPPPPPAADLPSKAIIGILDNNNNNNQKLNITNNNVNNNNQQTRVWTMKNVYDYYSSRGCGGGHNLALASWASAVKSKPIDPKTMVDTTIGMTLEPDSGGSAENSGGEKEVENGVIIIDDEKEEGELEEGEIDLDSDVVNPENEFHTLEVKAADLEVKSALILKGIDNVDADCAEKSFREVYSLVEDVTDSLHELADEISIKKKDDFIRIFFTAIKSLKTIFPSMSENHKEQTSESMKRFVTSLMDRKRPVLSTEQLKEMEAMVSSIHSSTVSTNTKAIEMNSEMPVIDGFGKSGVDVYTEYSNSDMVNDSYVEAIPMEISDDSEADEVVEVSPMYKASPLPLLDLHKDHDADSLPSPTRDAPYSLPISNALGIVGGNFKPEWPGPRISMESDTAPLHPYESDAVKRVSTYQQKFGRGSFFMSDELPSPTPSEDGNTADGGDISGEISSSICNVYSSSMPAAEVPLSSVTTKMDYLTAQVPQISWNPAPVSLVQNLPPKPSTAKNRDPRLRFLNSDGPISETLLPNEPKGEPALGMLSSRKQKTVEEPIVAQPALKKPRYDNAESRVVENGQTVTGSNGWRNDGGTVKPVFGKDPRKPAIPVSVGNSGSTTPNVTVSENLPVVVSTPLNDGGTVKPVFGKDPRKPAIPVSVGNSGTITPSVTVTENLPAISTTMNSLLQEFIVNPSVLMDLYNLEQQKSAASAKSTTQLPSVNVPLGSVPLMSSVTPSPTVVIKPSPAISQVVTHPAPVEESGTIRMKPRDPRRVLHSNTVSKGGSSDDQSVSKSSVSSVPGRPSILNEQSLGKSSTSSVPGRASFLNESEKKVIPKSSSNGPDITSQFTKNLQNIADLVSVSQSSLPLASVSHMPTSQPAPAFHGRLASSMGSDLIQSSTGLTSREASTVPSQPQPENNWGDVEHLFDGFDDQQKAAIQKERARRMEEQKKMFAARKLCLVLDLDHTLLNSAKFDEVETVYHELLRLREEEDRANPRRHLFRFPHMQMWTKLRPGIWNFLERASKLFELHLYTMGNKLYATEMAKVLDPKGVLFAGRVISRGDDTDPVDGEERAPRSKDLEGVLGMESSVLIIDDSIRVWPHNRLNLIVVERYLFFPCSIRQFGLAGRKSLLENGLDERLEDGTLATCLSVIERIHSNFFSHQSLIEADVRNILASELRKVLAGCRIVFSRVFPVGEAKPHLHPIWQTAEQFGAVCTNSLDEHVTHVVANSLGTDKVNWALSHGKFVVTTRWVEASAALYRRANEYDFIVS